MGVEKWVKHDGCTYTMILPNTSGKWAFKYHRYFCDFSILDDFFWLYTGCLGLICLKWRIMSYFCHIKIFKWAYIEGLWGVLNWVEIKSVLNRKNGTRPTIWNLIYPPTTLIKMRNETLVFAVLYHFISNPVETLFNS